MEKEQTIEQLIAEMRDNAMALNSVYEKLVRCNLSAANTTLDSCIEYLNEKRTLSASDKGFTEKASRIFGY